MSKRKGNKAFNKPAATKPAEPAQEGITFAFDDPEGVMDKRQILDYIECTDNGKWYEPPISFDGLARSLHAAVHHSSPIYVKRNILASTFIAHPLLSQQAFSRYALDYLLFGNAFLELRKNQLGDPMRLDVSPAKYTRRGTENGVYWFVQNWKQAHQFAVGSVFHLIEPDINQELYGLPEYLSALNSAWLNESATLFRRRYYKNGGHAGYILYVTDAAQTSSDIEKMRKAMSDTKGLGNCRNLFMFAPNGKPDGIKVIPLSDVATKDDFFNIKNASRDDLLSAHRVPPQMMGIIPSNTGGFGDAAKAAQVFVRNELTPLQERMKDVNEWIGEDVIRFKPYELISED
ncbi:phage portal protein [Yersinia ruckeri]|uniref:phage portal protein n=1 Tax=Yersinia ruckeri TaxID=29486 RepID=UPI0020C17D6A|nr:phage portal protein [Yersinia ruckeri]MCW6525948.1 phage portal protein [Yersinia ruckeri]MCW6560761.1 phage portal protein [Yersinia ruckeri]UZY03577.1 phage portal protein [Yersinia ruckeri]